jgi:hypothetical protein
MPLAIQPGAPAGKPLHQFAQGRSRARAQPIRLAEQAGRHAHRHPLLPRHALHVANRRIPQAALGLIDNALKGQVIRRLGDDAQIRHRIADFRPLIEFRPPHHAIGQAQRDQALLKGPGLKPGADQNRHLGEILPGTPRRLDIASTILGLPRKTFAQRMPLHLVAEALGSRL